MSRSYKPSISDRHALLAWLAREFGEPHELGKTAIQKLIHILDEGLEAPTGYSFTLYTYGPFSRDLAGDIDIVKSLNGIQVDYIRDENRYVVSAGGLNNEVIARGSGYFDCFDSTLRALKSQFLGKRARYLELFSTLLFLQKRKPDIHKDDLCAQLRALKPKYDKNETLDAIGDLERFLKAKVSG